MALFELTDLGSYLQVAALDTNAAALARTRAEDYLRDELGVEFTNAARVHTARVPASRTFQRLSTPLDAVASVTANGVTLTEGTHWERTTTGVTCPAGFGRGPADLSTDLGDWCDLVINYTSGWATPPSDLVGWGIYLAATAMSLGPTPAVVQQSAGPFAVTVDRATAAAGGLSLPADVLRALRAKYGSGRRLTGTVSLR